MIIKYLNIIEVLCMQENYAFLCHYVRGIHLLANTFGKTEYILDALTWFVIRLSVKELRTFFLPFIESIQGSFVTEQ